MTQAHIRVSPESFACLKRGVFPPPFRPAPYPGDRHARARSNRIPAAPAPPGAHRRCSRPPGSDTISGPLPLRGHRALRGEIFLPPPSPNPHNPASCELRSTFPQPVENEAQRPLFPSFPWCKTTPISSPPPLSLSVPSMSLWWEIRLPTLTKGPSIRDYSTISSFEIALPSAAICVIGGPSPFAFSAPPRATCRPYPDDRERPAEKPLAAFCGKSMLDAAGAPRVRMLRTAEKRELTR
jgi:hypothetical protein